MPDWKALRHQFPLLDRYIYLNACSLGPLPRRGRAALERYANDWDTKGTPVWYSEWLPLLERLRTRVGGLLNAPQGSTAIAPSVSVALTTLASGLPLARGQDAFRLKSGRGIPGKTVLQVDNTRAESL